jgi:hypothetical protein
MRAMPERLRHYTANTGDLAVTGRDEVGDDMLAVLVPMVSAGSGDFPDLGLGFDVTLGHPGMASYQIGPAGARPPGSAYVMGIVCWRAEEAPGAWTRFREYADLDLEVPRLIISMIPPAVPWLGVRIMEACARAALSIGTCLIIMNLERCLAWAVIEAHR